MNTSEEIISEYKKNEKDLKLLQNTSIYSKNAINDKKTEQIYFTLIVLSFFFLIYICHDYLKNLTIFLYFHLDSKGNVNNNSVLMKISYFFNSDCFSINFKRLLVILIYNTSNIFYTLIFIVFDNIGIINTIFYDYYFNPGNKFLNITSLVLMYYIASISFRDVIHYRTIFNKNCLTFLLVIIFIIEIYFNILKNFTTDFEYNFIEYLIYSIGMSCFIIYVLFGIFEIEFYSRKNKTARQFFILFNVNSTVQYIFCSLCIYILLVYYATIGNDVIIKRDLSQIFFLIGSLLSTIIEYTYIFRNNLFLFSSYNLNVNESKSSNNSNNSMSKYIFNNTNNLKTIIRIKVMYVISVSINYFCYNYSINYTNNIIRPVLHFIEAIVLFCILKIIFKMKEINLMNDKLFNNRDELNSSDINEIDNHYIIMVSSNSSKS